MPNQSRNFFNFTTFIWSFNSFQTFVNLNNFYLIPNNLDSCQFQYLYFICQHIPELSLFLIHVILDNLIWNVNFFQTLVNFIFWIDANIFRNLWILISSSISNLKSQLIPYFWNLYLTTSSISLHILMFFYVRILA